MKRRIALLLPAALVIAALAAPSAQGARTKSCSEPTGRDHFILSFTQTPSCKSNSDVNRDDETVTNRGGGTPPGQQP